VILVPAGFLSGLPPAQVEALLLHELAHVRRHDVLVERLQAVVETLFFFHPATWWISKRVRRARSV
jgi:beta-lactamase regulating signal transducer with metallopeptidase domain